MFSNTILVVLAAALPLLTSATPTPGTKHSGDKRPSGVPYWNNLDGTTTGCGDQCSYECWDFKKKTIYIQGQRSSSMYGAISAEVKFGDEIAVPQKVDYCFDCKEVVFPGNNNNGWELTMHQGGAPMEGPLAYTLKFPWDVALFSVGDGKPYNSNQVISQDDHECDAQSCMGPNLPSTCRKCSYRQSYEVYHATPIPDDKCFYWEG